MNDGHITPAIAKVSTGRIGQREARFLRLLPINGLMAPLVVFVSLLCLTLAAVAQQMSCSDIAKLRLPDVRITEAVARNKAVENGGMAVDQRVTAARMLGVSADGIEVAHCKVTGVIGTETHFELLLPDDWNGRFFMGGGGGFVGQVVNTAWQTVNLGYATVGTDTGHRGAITDASWALNHIERQLNFGYLAVHQTAEVAKAIIHAYYGSDPQYNYFIGCSRGGGQGMMAAQRYPEDFDGIVAGAPAFDWSGLAAEMIHNIQLNFPDPDNLSSPVISPANRRLLATQILETCDALDGVEDGVMTDPRDCNFDRTSIPACPDDRPGAHCFTAAQRAAIERIYAPVANEQTPIYPGQPYGGENDPEGWQNWITGINDTLYARTQGQVPSLVWVFGTEIYKYFVFNNPDWDYTAYDYANWRDDTRRMSSMLDATDPDLGAFNAHGGRLILWHGWSDPVLNAHRTIAYYEAVAKHDPKARDDLRLYLMPGVLHCRGGAGADVVNWLKPITAWVEHGKTPERIIATKLDERGAVVRTRPLCPYPQRAVYTGEGSTDKAASFTCRRP